MVEVDLVKEVVDLAVEEVKGVEGLDWFHSSTTSEARPILFAKKAR